MRPDVRVLYGHLTIMTAWPDHSIRASASVDVTAFSGVPPIIP